MANALQVFVKEALDKHISRKQIREKLSQAGWQTDEIDNALAAYLDVDFEIPVPKRKPYLSAREAFLYLMMFLTLYISAVSVGTILFQLINRGFPDLAQNLYEGATIVSAIRSATAALIIAFPIFILISWLLNRTFVRDPEKRGSKVRKWLTYITLFLAAGVIIGDLITLVSNLLSGELTVRFVLKVLVVLVIAGLVFGYYLWDLRKEESEA